MPQNESAEWWHRLRRMVFGVYEKYGYDRALETIKNLKTIPPFKAGLTAEIIFYEKNRAGLGLEPLLDVGVKADFTGLDRSIPTNFDVTTNLDYKEIDDYVKVIQERKKRYEVVVVNTKSEEIVRYPLLFPICDSCGKFSHHILYLRPSTNETNASNGVTDEQSIVKYCSHCKSFKEEQTHDYLVESISHNLGEFSADKDEDEDQEAYEKRELEFAQGTSIPVVKFFEKRSTLLISALAENQFTDTYPYDGSGYYQAGLHWAHPLARDLRGQLPFFYGEWTPTVAEVRKLLGNPKCPKCGQQLTINPSTKIAGCRKDMVLYNYSESLVYSGFELQASRPP
jgi:hypothetical protein